MESAHELAIRSLRYFTVKNSTLGGSNLAIVRAASDPDIDGLAFGQQNPVSILKQRQFMLVFLFETDRFDFKLLIICKLLSFNIFSSLTFRIV